MALTQFANRHITRTSNTVAFGCGAVTVAKEDLITLANFLDANPKMATSLPKAALVINNYGQVMQQGLTVVDPTGLKALGKVLTVPQAYLGLRAFKRLVIASGEYYGAKAIATIPPATLHQIAGVRKTAVKQVKFK